MSRVLTVPVCDSSGKDCALQCAPRALSLISAWRQRSGRVHRQQPLQLQGKLRRKQVRGGREHCVQCMFMPPFSATSATTCALCTANNLCPSLRSCMRAAEELCRMIMAATATAMRAFTVMLMVRQPLVLRAVQQNPRSRKHKALARPASTLHGDVRSMQQPRQLALAWCRTQKTLTRHSQHPSLMSPRTMQTWMHLQILSRMQLLRRMQVQTRKQTQVLMRTRVQPCHLAALASASVAVHAKQSEPAQQAACDSGLYTCGAVLMPAGHALDPTTYCNAVLTCAACGRVLRAPCTT
jgi:hypothetical protein